MTQLRASRARRVLARVADAVALTTGVARRELTEQLGGAQRARVVVVLACVLGLAGADTATVGASASELRAGLGIGNAGIGLLVTSVSLVGALAGLPWGVLADRVRRTWTLAAAVACWGAAMAWSASASDFAELLLARLLLGAFAAAAGPLVASMVGDYFAAGERGRIYAFILAGELVGAGFGFAVSGDLAVLSWRVAFASLVLPAVVLAVLVARLPEPARGGEGHLPDQAAGRGRMGRPRSPSEPAADRHADAQRLVRERGIPSDPATVLRGDARAMSLVAATRFVLRLRTNVLLIAASACGYYFLAGVETFGVEFARDQYGANQAVINLVLLLVGAGALGGVFAGGWVGDVLLRRGRLTGRVTTAAVAVTVTCVLFLPALLTHSLVGAVPYLVGATFFLTSQNPPLDAARLDIMPGPLWGRAEAVRALVRSLAQSLAPLVFGVFSEYVAGGGASGLRITFGVMLAPLAVGAVLLFRARRTYPVDVASAAAWSA